jgi:predicted Abi (CAAX) family protease
LVGCAHQQKDTAVAETRYEYLNSGSKPYLLTSFDKHSFVNDVLKINIIQYKLLEKNIIQYYYLGNKMVPNYNSLKPLNDFIWSEVEAEEIQKYNLGKFLVSSSNFNNVEVDWEVKNGVAYIDLTKLPSTIKTNQIITLTCPNCLSGYSGPDSNKPKNNPDIVSKLIFSLNYSQISLLTNRQNLLYAERERLANDGDGSADDLLCKKYGFKPNT